MDPVLLVLLLLWAFLGHLVLSVALVNRVHATGIPVPVGKLVWLSTAVLVTAIPLFFAYWLSVRSARSDSGAGLAHLPAAAIPYLATCWATAAIAAAHWAERRVFHRPPAPLRSDRRRVVRLLAHGTLGSEDHEHHFLVRLPGNETLHLDVAERALDLEFLPQELDELTIIHMTDLHFTGRIAKAYFQEVVRICNDLQPDLIAITGDLVDKPACIDWIPDTLGRLKSRYGVFYVLGNHDLQVDTVRLRGVLSEAGLIDLGSRWAELAVGEQTVVLAGNELPWIVPAADLENAPPPASAGGPVRIALAHSPDQLPWARRHAVDLLLAGHLHGGQIRLPFLGPIVSPSRRGVTYAAGTFHDPPTVMHVSRGVSGEIPLRFNCPPEVARLVLHAPVRHGAG